MVLDTVTSDPAAEVLSQTIELLVEIAFEAKNAFVQKEGFAELASYLDRIVPLLKELNKKGIGDVENSFVEILNRQVKVAKQLTTECGKNNRFYLLMNCRSISKRIERVTRELSRALSLIPFAQLDVSETMKLELGRLCESMQSAEFKTAIAEETILEKIELGIHERNVDCSYANKLLVSIAETVGISTERFALKKEFEEFKSEIEEDAQLRQKNQAEAIRMDQIIALLERADATCSPEEKERKYLKKRNSLGSQPLEPLGPFYCPITREVMADPVETYLGHTFERSAIEKWLADGNNSCPMGRIPLENRTLRPNRALRQSIEEWKDRNTMITIASIKTKLSRPLLDNEEAVLRCLERLQNLCEQKELHREWIMVENYIPILVGFLEGKNRDIRNHALLMLCILAKDSDDAKDRIGKVNGVMESVVHSLGRRISEGKLAAELLLELSANETIRDRIGTVQGCILLLVTMSNSDNVRAATHARGLLDKLSYSDQNVIQMAKANYFTFLLQRLSSGSDDVKTSMVTALAEMELTDHNKSSLFKEGALDSLLNLLSHANPTMKKTSLKALCNLSSLPKNGLQMIRKGSVTPLMNLLYHPTSSHGLREEAAAIIMHLAVSTVAQSGGEAAVSLFESDGDVDGLFSFIGGAVPPSVQESLLRVFHALCRSPSASGVKAKLKENSENIQSLVLLCDNDDRKVRASAVKLFCCLTEDNDNDNGNDRDISEQIGRKPIQTLVRIIRFSDDPEEIAAAMGVISNLPPSPRLTESLLSANGLPVISSRLLDDDSRLLAAAVGSLRHLTVPTNQESQRKAAAAGVIPALVRLAERGAAAATRRDACVSLAQFSLSSSELTRPPPRRQRLFRCHLSAPPDSGRCPVHRGVCGVSTSFCLMAAGAVGPLTRALADPDGRVGEAALDALLTLVDGGGGRVQDGCRVLAEADAVAPIVRLLGRDSSPPRVQEKVLAALERVFGVVEMKQRFGNLAQMALVDLTQRGNRATKSAAARILGQLNVLHQQSSYF